MGRRVHLPGLGFSRPPHAPPYPCPRAGPHPDPAQVHGKFEGGTCRDRIPCLAFFEVFVEAETCNKCPVGPNLDGILTHLMGKKEFLEDGFYCRIVREL